MADKRFREQMTPKERVAAALTGQPFDRIPCECFISEHAAKLIGAKVSDMHLQASVRAAAQIAGYKIYHTDGISVGPSLVGVAEAMGSEVAFPAHSTPYISRFAVNKYADLEKLSPADPQRDGRLPVIVDALQRVIDAVGDEVTITTNLAGPFTVAANLRGTESFMRDLYRQPLFVHRLLRLATDSCRAFVQAAAKLNVYFSIAEPTASGSLLGPQHFRQFVKPYLTELIAYSKASGGLSTTLHICGNTKPIWADMADTGADMLSIDDVVDLAEVKAAVGDRVVLTGNVRPTQTMSAKRR